MINDIDWQKWRLLKERATPGIKKDKSQMIISLPKFSITKDWGKESATPEVVKKIADNIGGVTFTEKIESLNSFIGDCDDACVNAKDVSEILANLMLLDIFSSMIHDYNAQQGGYMFENLVALLTKGTAIGSKQGIVDVRGNDRKQDRSVKMLGGSGYVQGSLDKLKKYIVENQIPLTYLTGLKEEKKKTGLKEEKKKTGLKQKEKNISILFCQFTVGLTEEDNQARQQEGKDPIKGDFTYRDIGENYGLLKSKVKKNHQVGSLELGSREQVQVVAEKYVEKLGDVLVEIYKQLDSLSTNINKYFLTSDSSRHVHLQNARISAKTLKDKTEELD